MEPDKKKDTNPARYKNVPAASFSIPCYDKLNPPDNVQLSERKPGGVLMTNKLSCIALLAPDHKKFRPTPIAPIQILDLSLRH